MAALRTGITLGPSPACLPSLQLRAEIALTVNSADNRLVIIAVAWHTIDALAVCADIPFDVATHADLSDHRFTALDQLNSTDTRIAVSGDKARTCRST